MQCSIVKIITIHIQALKAFLNNAVPLNSSRYSAERKKYASSFFEEYVQAIDSWLKVLQIPVGKELRCDKTLETRSVLRPGITSDACLYTSAPVC